VTFLTLLTTSSKSLDLQHFFFLFPAVTLVLMSPVHVGSMRGFVIKITTCFLKPEMALLFYHIKRYQLKLYPVKNFKTTLFFTPGAMLLQ